MQKILKFVEEHIKLTNQMENASTTLAMREYIITYVFLDFSLNIESQIIDNVVYYCISWVDPAFTKKVGQSVAKKL